MCLLLAPCSSHLLCCIVPLVILLHCIKIILPWFAYLSLAVRSCVNPSSSYLYHSFLHHAHTINRSSSSPKLLSHPNFSFSLSFNYFSSDIFCSILMLTIFLYSLHHAKTTSSSFQVFWKCFGWPKDLFNLELFSNLFEFAVSKNCESIFIQMLHNSWCPWIFCS